MSLKLLPALLVVLVVFAGCGQSEEEKATAQICTARDGIAKQVDKLQGLTITTATTSQVGDGLKAIRNDLSTISDARGQLSGESRDEIEKANDAFVASVRETAADVGRAISLETASADVSAAVQKLAASYRSTLGQIQIDCP
jgi:hypothetical protein